MSTEFNGQSIPYIQAIQAVEHIKEAYTTAIIENVADIATLKAIDARINELLTAQMMAVIEEFADQQDIDLEKILPPEAGNE